MHLEQLTRKSKPTKLFPIVDREILYMDHPKNQFFFFFGLPGFYWLVYWG